MSNIPFRLAPASLVKLPHWRLRSHINRSHIYRSSPPILCFRNLHSTPLGRAKVVQPRGQAWLEDIQSNVAPQSRIEKTHQKPKVTNAESSGDSVTFSLWPTHDAIRYDAIYLRDACPCPQCVDRSTSQKLFETADIPKEIQAGNISVLDDGNVNIEWTNDLPEYSHHKSTYPAAFLYDNRTIYSRYLNSNTICRRTQWDRDTMKAQQVILPYNELVAFDDVLYKGLRHLEEYGLLFISEVPSDPFSVNTIANRIGPIRETFYGSVWDVRSKPEPKNVAYTSTHLGFHQDLLYMADPPAIQLLHCMQASTEGGESLFADGFTAHEKLLRQGKEDLLTALRGFPVTFRYKNDGKWYQYTRPTIEYDHSIFYASKDWKGDREARGFAPHISAVNWGPPFQGPLEAEAGDGVAFSSELGRKRLQDFLQAAKEFKGLIEAPEAIFETRMEQGTCVIFDNRRLVHGRRAFSSKGGERWLRGAYVDRDAFSNRLRTLRAQSLTDGWFNQMNEEQKANV